MTTCLGKSCTFGTLCLSFVNVYQFVCEYLSFPFGFEGGMWDLIVLIPDHTLIITGVFRRRDIGSKARCHVALKHVLRPVLQYRKGKLFHILQPACI